jgi:hypothetical protein
LAPAIPPVTDRKQPKPSGTVGSGVKQQRNLCRKPFETEYIFVAVSQNRAFVVIPLC